jgi:catechol 2,3-dioxygenase-like lactoylglutathione lyase family enzyme
MNHNALSIRPFIGAKDYELSRAFYRDPGFEERILSPAMCLFITGQTGFYLQNAYVKDWVDNSMIFLEVDDVYRYWKELLALGLTDKYAGVKLTDAKNYDWGSECFMHDPSGILWHFGQFNKQSAI